jgi:hypothetical protein
MIIFRAMSDIQDEGVSTDDSERKSEDGAYVWTKKDVEVAHKIEENSSHQHERSQSVDSHSDGSETNSSGKSSPNGMPHSGVAVTFGITASDTLTPVDNLSGWKITWLSKTYNKVVGLTGLTRRGDFRVRTIFVSALHLDKRLTFALLCRTSSIRSTCLCMSATPLRRVSGLMA